MYRTRQELIEEVEELEGALEAILDEATGNGELGKIQELASEALDIGSEEPAEEGDEYDE